MEPGVSSVAGRTSKERLGRAGGAVPVERFARARATSVLRARAGGSTALLPLGVLHVSLVALSPLPRHLEES